MFYDEYVGFSKTTNDIKFLENISNIAQISLKKAK